MSLPKVDVVIVGCGAAGGIMAKELSTNGMKVVALDRGDFLRTRDVAQLDELRYQSRGELQQPILNDTPVQWRPDEKTDTVPLPFMMASGIGGSTRHYTSMHWRMLPHHFKQYSENVARYGADVIPAGTSLVDWPMSYEELAPYYDKVDQEIGISGQAGNINGAIQPGGNPFEGPRNKDYPMPPLLESTVSRIARPVMERLGYDPFPIPSSIATENYKGRPACTYCSFCSSYYCFIGSKGSTNVTILPIGISSGNLEIRPNVRVIKINKNSDGTKATGVTYLDADGKEQDQPAGLVIVSSYTYENIRLLLHSDINKNGMVGKYFMDHHYPFVWGYFDTTITNPSTGPWAGNLAIDNFNGDNFDHTGLGFIEGGVLAPLGGNLQAIAGSGSGFWSIPMPDGTPTFGEGYKQALKKYFTRVASMFPQIPSLPYDANYCDLHPTIKDQIGMPVLRITYNAFDNEIKAGTYLQNIVENILTDMGVAKIKKGGLFLPPATTHEVGGVRMGTDPIKSVLNKYLQSWELPNMFVVGGAVFPTYFGYNPTHTIEALAFWSSDYIKKEVKPGGALAQYL